MSSEQKNMSRDDVVLAFMMLGKFAQEDVAKQFNTSRRTLMREIKALIEEMDYLHESGTPPRWDSLTCVPFFFVNNEMSRNIVIDGVNNMVSVIVQKRSESDFVLSNTEDHPQSDLHNHGSRVSSKWQKFKNWLSTR